MTVNRLKAGRFPTGAILKGPVPGIAKSISPPAAFVFTSSIASRNEPGPESLVLITTRRSKTVTLKLTVFVRDWLDTALVLRSNTLIEIALTPESEIGGV